MSEILVSVIMPTHNDERYLSTSVDSVLAQTFTQWELLIIDDCSTDGTAKLIADYCQRDNRIKSLRTERASGSPTLPRNMGIAHAQGRFIAFLDSDDQWLPTKLARQVPLLQEKTDSVMVFSNYRLMDEDGVQYRQSIVAPPTTNYQQLLKGNVIGCLTVMYDTQKTGKCFFPSLGHEDYALWLSMLKRGGTVYNTNTFEAVYRMKRGSVSSNKLRAMGWQWYIYTRVEQLGTLRSAYYFVNYAIRAVNKRWNLLELFFRRFI